MSEIPPAAVERGAKALLTGRGVRGLFAHGFVVDEDVTGSQAELAAHYVLTAAHDELIQAWIRSRLDDPETVERVKMAIWEAKAQPRDLSVVDRVGEMARAAISALLGAEDDG